MLKPIKNILSDEKNGTGSKTKLYSKGFEKRWIMYAKMSDIDKEERPKEN